MNLTKQVYRIAIDIRRDVSASVVLEQLVQEHVDATGFSYNT